jgi:hypothetical protein
MKTRLTGLVAIALAGAAVTAQAITLTFDELAPVSGGASVNVGNSYSHDGFTITGAPQPGWQNSGFYVVSATDRNWTGSAGLAYLAVGTRIELVANNGALFDVASIDISRGDWNNFLVPVGFGGLRADGTWVGQTYWFTDSVHGRNEKVTFSNEFRALKSLVWYQGAAWHQFDNLTVTAVPEPQTYALMLAGLGLIAGVAHRRSRQA